MKRKDLKIGIYSMGPLNLLPAEKKTGSKYRALNQITVLKSSNHCAVKCAVLNYISR